MDYVIEYYHGGSWVDITGRIAEFDLSLEIGLVKMHILEYHGISFEYRRGNTTKIVNGDFFRIKLINGTTEYLFSGRAINVIDSNKTRLRSFDVECEIEYMKTISIGSTTNLYRFTVSGITTLPDNDSIYGDSNSNEYEVLGHNMGGGMPPHSGLIDCRRIGGSSDPPANGTLTRHSGVGDFYVSFSAFTKSFSAGYIPGFRHNWRLESQLLSDYSVVCMDVNADSIINNHFLPVEAILYPSMFANDLIFDTLLIANCYTTGINNRVFLNIVNKELRFFSADASPKTPVISSLEDIEQGYTDEDLTFYYRDRIDTELRGNGVSGSGSGSEITYNMRKHKINSFEKFDLFDELFYLSDSYGFITGIEKKGNMYKYSMTEMRT